MEYRYSIFYRVSLLIALLFAFFGGIEIGKSNEYVLAFIVILSIIYFALLILNYRIVITDAYIMVELGMLGKKIERNWDKIYRVSRIPFIFIWIYRIYCKDKPTLIFTNCVSNYKELLKEIVGRSPNAVVDDSIKKLLF